MIFNLKQICCITALVSFFALNIFANDDYTYSRILLETTNGQELFKTLAENDLYIDHAARSKEGFVIVFNNKEIQQLKETGIKFKVLIDDLEKYQAKRIAQEMQRPEIKQRLSSKRMGFDYGSHAGYNTPAELYAKLDEISNTYPNIAATKVSIGTTFEGRDIYMIKISDNPNTDESATEPAVYYDAMHHAREPLSMMSTLYYMFWLVENYGIDPIATHIIDNRELFFVPLVNVDGYEYNISTNPSGGGFWRKNRRPDLSSGCVGTDPNRNYGTDWGGPGASTNPCSDTYRGSGPFSEPCTQAVRDLVNSINPIMAFSCHSYSEIYIESDWDAANAEQFYADYSLDICAEHNFGYEQGESLLYAVSGGTTEFLNAAGAISYTPEIGSVFWEPISQIIPYAEKHLPAFIYIAQVAGDYPDVKQAIINNGNDILAGQTYNVDVELFNKGRTQTANNISVSISAISANASIVNNITTVANLAARQSVWTAANPLQISISNGAAVGDIVEVEIEVSANGVEYEKEMQRWVVGNQNVLFAEDGSNGLGGFTSVNNGFLDWDTTYVMRRSGIESISDSPLQAADNYTLNYLMTSNPISLTNTTQPVLEFWIAWGVSNFNTYSGDDPNDDNCRLEINVNNGGWQAISADDTQNINGGPRFVLNNPWAKQIVDLSPYIGSSIEFRFALDASDFSEPDGVFIDDLRVVDYESSTSMPTALIDGNSTLNICEGESITVSHSSNNFDSFIWNSGDGTTSTANPATFTYNTQGVYTLSLQATNANGSDTDNITVIVDAATPVTIVSLPSSVGNNQPVTLSATPAGGVFSGNGVIFNAFNPSIAGPGMHTITYTYTNSSNCTSTTTTSIFVFSITYVFVNYNLGTISPKLIEGAELVIDSKLSTNYDVGVYDVSGRELYTDEITVEPGIQNTGIQPFKNLNKGLYIFTISNGQEVLTEKVYLAQ